MSSTILGVCGMWYCTHTGNRFWFPFADASAAAAAAAAAAATAAAAAAAAAAHQKNNNFPEQSTIFRPQFSGTGDSRVTCVLRQPPRLMGLYLPGVIVAEIHCKYIDFFVGEFSCSNFK